SRIERLLPRRIWAALTRTFETAFSQSCADARWLVKWPGDRSAVLRAELAPRSGAPSTVIIKCCASAAEEAVTRLNREVSFIRYVRDLPDDRLSAAAPLIYGHDPALGVIVME